MRANEDQKTVLFDPIRDYFGGDLKGKRIALWGLAFKPETDDIREAPALYMIDRLVNAGAEIIAFDPEAMDNVKGDIGEKVEYAENHLDALNGADALLICTEWQVFRNPDMSDVKQRLKRPVVFDGRNLYELDSMRELNFFYKSIGRSTVHPV
jgi:UDPglucose 6-dehydrogenase